MLTSLVRVYSDEGISGLKIDNRRGLLSLIQLVAAGRPDFSKVLVYDVSRWGRFQDADESAHYEFCCRQNGVDVIYCAEPFHDDKSPLSAVIKSMKRAMAAEYSRELGARVHRASCTIASRGYNPGGLIPYGCKFLLVDSKGKVLKHRIYQKTLQDCRVVLAPGPAREVRIVREIFRRYVNLDETPDQIAAYLNNHGYRTRSGGRWPAGSIAYMLGNEKYIGTQTYNRTSARLRTKVKWNEYADWIRKPGAFDGIVDADIFERAQARRKTRIIGPIRSDGELLAMLRDLINEHGVVNGEMLGRANAMPSRATYLRRFGTLRRAYDLVGYDLYTTSIWVERKQLEDLRSSILLKIESEVIKRSMKINILSTSRLVVGRGVQCSFTIIRRGRGKVAGYRWHLRIRHVSDVHLHLVGRLGGNESKPLDYYLVPTEATYDIPAMISRRNIHLLDQYRCSNLRAVAERLVALSADSPSPQRRLLLQMQS